MLLNNVELNWVKLDKNNPDMGYDKNTPQYSLVVTTADKKISESWTKAGINVKPREDNGKILYNATLKKKIYKDEQGRIITPPPVVVDKDLQPITDVQSIGNGSIGNVQVKFKSYEYMGRKGTSVQLMAVQLVKKVEYATDKIEFEPVNTDTDEII